MSPIVGVCNCSMFCCTLLYVPSSFAIILLGCLAKFVYLVSRECYVALPRGAMGLSAFCSNKTTFTVVNGLNIINYICNFSVNHSFSVMN